VKRTLMLILALVSLSTMTAASAAEDSDFVTVEGTVYIWNLDNAYNATADMDDFADIPGGEYRIARNIYVEVEFGWFSLDLVTYTDESGRYWVQKRNPWIGDYSVNIEVWANILLDTSIPDEINQVNMFPAGTDLFFFYEGRTNIYPYNGETDTALVGDGETLVMDVYIGGPGVDGGYSVSDWWDEYPGDHLLGFYSVEVIRDAYVWAINHNIPNTDIYREVSLMYPVGDTAKYAPFNLPAGVGHIDVDSRKLYPDELMFPDSIGEQWQDLRTTLIHEYGHKIMHDVYTVLPMDFQDPKCTGHSIDATITGECGWVEGWAEFFGAAVQDRQTVNGGLDDSNIEHTHHPYPLRLAASGLGVYEWRDLVDDGEQSICEGENAAVLWDIYDPKGWEYMLPVQQEASQDPTVRWPAPMRWYDRLTDPHLEAIWTIIREDDPDRLTDEDASFEYTNDGFWKYWRDNYSSDTERLHGLKAILYNREIETDPYTENSPIIEVLGVDRSARKAQVRITEADPEDRPFLYYNIAYRKDSTSPYRLVQYTDRLVSTLGGTWEGNTLLVDVTVPPAVNYSDLIFMVHDSMQAYFYAYMGGAGGSSGGSSGGGEAWQELTLMDKGALPGLPAGGRMVEKDGLLYVAALGDGLRIYDLRTHPNDPDELGSFTSTDFLPWPIDIDGNYVFIADTDQVFILDVSDPGNPHPVDEFTIEPPADFITLGLEYYEGYLYYTAGYEGMYILKVNEGGMLSLAGNYRSEDCLDGSDVVAYSDTLYLICETQGMQILDISNTPASPRYIGFWEIATPSIEIGGRRLHEDTVLDANNKLLYMAVTWDGIYVFDLSTPQSPTVKAIIKSNGAVFGLSLLGDALYTTESWPGGVTAIDISNLDEPVELAYLDRANPGFNILAAGDYVYVTEGTSGLSLIKIVQP